MYCLDKNPPIPPPVIPIGSLVSPKTTTIIKNELIFSIHDLNSFSLGQIKNLNLLSKEDLIVILIEYDRIFKTTMENILND
jgi:hypothetical protein